MLVPQNHGGPRSERVVQRPGIHRCCAGTAAKCASALSLSLWVMMCAACHHPPEPMTGPKATSGVATTMQQPQYAFSSAWIDRCAEEDLEGAEYVPDMVSKAEPGEVLPLLRELRQALAILQLERQFLDVRHPLFLSDADQRRLARKLASRFEMGSIRHAAS